MTDTALHDLTLAQVAALIRTRKLSPVEYTRALLARTDEIEPQLSAYITRTSEAAMEAARAAEAEIARGNYRGPLHGIPFAVKDIYDTAGVLTSGHSRTCIDRVPRKDATAVAKLRAAGAVLMGKLATHEFAHGGPSFDLPWPPARNPWDTAHFTGGSSSGSGAAIAAGLVPVSLGPIPAARFAARLVCAASPDSSPPMVSSAVPACCRTPTPTIIAGPWRGRPKTAH